jgi:hypothetical protein
LLKALVLLEMLLSIYCSNHLFPCNTGGQAKTLMFVHVNPETDSFSETMSTLKFAERVATIELGAARANKEAGQVKDLKEEV